jgi:predicted transposase YbfD/YdcC
MEVEATVRQSGETAYSLRQFLSSSDDIAEKEIARSTELHWGVENGSRWHSGAAFKADSNKTACTCGTAQLQALKAITSNAPDALQDSARKEFQCQL